MGQGKTDEVSQSFTIVVVFSLVLSVVLTVAGYATLQPLVELLGGRDGTLAPAMEYLRGIYLGVVPIMMSTVLMALVRIDGSKKLPLLSIMVMTVVDVVLDILVATV